MKLHTKTLNFLTGMLKGTDGPARSHRRNQSKRRLSVTLQTETLEDRRLMTTTINHDPNPPLYLVPGTPAWFQSNMSDPGVRNLAEGDFANHSSLTRADMLGIFSEVEGQGAMTANELHDLRFLVANGGVLDMPADVEFEANRLVNSDAVTYQGNYIGYLQVGSSVSLQVELVDKYFLGLDHPVAAANYSNAFSTTTANAPMAAIGGTANSANSSGGGGLYVGSGPSYLNVHQGNLGDCWLMGSLAAVAASHPTLINYMFTDDGAAQETVTIPNTHIQQTVQVEIWSVRFFMPNGNACYVTVDSMLPDGGGYYDHPSVTGDLGNGSLWAALAEKAYVQANGDGLVQSNLTFDNAYAALAGGDPDWALQAVVGTQASYVVNPSNVMAALGQQENIIVMDTGATVANSNLVTTHSYALVYVNPAASSPFELYNPWGTNSANVAPYTFNGHSVWGQFTTTQAFLTQNFIGSTNSARNTAAGTDATFLPPITTTWQPGGVHDEVFSEMSSFDPRFVKGSTDLADWLD
ncbi:MAG TPA: C2 family cysteine protease [Pirellulales bacterium]|nr:C2 family cysteine protease [Pirellulales bacterium]